MRPIWLNNRKSTYCDTALTLVSMFIYFIKIGRRNQDCSADTTSIRRNTNQIMAFCGKFWVMVSVTAPHRSRKLCFNRSHNYGSWFFNKWDLSLSSFASRKTNGSRPQGILWTNLKHNCACFDKIVICVIFSLTGSMQTIVQECLQKNPMTGGSMLILEVCTALLECFSFVLWCQ